MIWSSKLIIRLKYVVQCFIGMFTRRDLQKITTTLLKDLDQLARNGIRDEFASLDPLLRNLTSFDEPPLTANGKFGLEFDTAA